MFAVTVCIGHHHWRTAAADTLATGVPSSQPSRFYLINTFLPVQLGTVNPDMMSYVFSNFAIFF